MKETKDIYHAKEVVFKTSQVIRESHHEKIVSTCFQSSNPSNPYNPSSTSRHNHYAAADNEDGEISQASMTPDMHHHEMHQFTPQSVEIKPQKMNSQFLYGKLGVLEEALSRCASALIKKNKSVINSVQFTNVICTRERMNTRLKTDVSKGWDCLALLKVIFFPSNTIQMHASVSDRAN